MLALVLVLGLLGLQAPVPVLQEDSFLTSALPDNRVFGRTLELAGERLALTGSGPFSEEIHVLRREGRAWVSELELLDVGGLPSSYDRSDFDGEHLLLASGENVFAVTYRRVGAAWVQEQFFPGSSFGGLHGNRLATSRFLGSPADSRGVSLWREAAAGWELDATLLPTAPQSSGTCCAPVDLWGNTVAFRARDAQGRTSIQVHVRSGGAWHPEAELWPASGGFDVLDLRLHGGKLAALVLERPESPGATAFVFERTQGVWSEVARLCPEGAASLDLDRDTLVLGLLTDDGGDGSALVVERDADRWQPTHELRASDGRSLGIAVALEGRTVAVAAAFDPERPGRTYLFRLPALARANSYGCGVNPPGSLVLLEGRPALGTDLTLGVDDPSQTWAEGALVFLCLSRRADVHQPCGTLVPAAGLAGGPGEFLLRLDGTFPVQVRLAGTLARPGPLPVRLRIPASTALVGHTFYVQAALHDPAPGPRNPWGLTTALELTLGR